MDAYLNEVVRYLVAQSWQIAVLTAAVAAVTFALRHHSAHVRYLLWLIVLAKCLVPPLYMVPLRVLPPLALDGIPDGLLQPDWPVGRSGASRPASPEESAVQIQEAPQPAQNRQAGERRLSVSQWLGIIWIFGAGACGTMNLLRALRGHHWLRKSRKPLAGDMQIDTTNMLRAYGIRRLPRIWIVDGVGQPFVWGLVRGSIYVPPGFLTTESHEHRRNILAHELSHIIRFDAAVNFLQTVAQAIFWFHPFVWWANKRIRVEREKCCDEMAVARLGTPAKDYCNAVVETLANMKKSTRPVPSLAVAGPVKNIEERIRTMLRPGKRFYQRPSLLAAIVVLLAALLIVPTALALTAAAETKAAPEPEKKPARSLHQAAAAGDRQQVDKLLPEGANVNERGPWGYTPLHRASMRGNVELAKLLISKGAYVNAPDGDDGMMPLHHAAASGNIQTVELLLSKGADLDAKQKGGRTPLFDAMKSTEPGRKEIVELLVAKGAKVPALHLAAYMGDMDKLKKCLEDGADVNIRGDDGGTALHAAACSGRKDIVELLISRGANVDPKDASGMTPLYYAATHNAGEIVDLLVAKGADVNAKGESDSALLLYAIGQDESKDAVNLLLSKGANINVKDEDGWTPLVWALWCGGRDMMELLLSKGADANQEDNYGVTAVYWTAIDGRKDLLNLLIAKGAAPLSAIHSAVCAGDLAKVKSLVEAGTDVDTRAKGSGGQTPLFAAVFTDHDDVAEFLIAKGADVNAKDREGVTPLHYACEHGKRNMAELLIAKGADVNAKSDVNASDGGGRTPLHRMFISGVCRMDIAELLIAKGANVNARDREGMTPLHYAVESGHTEIVRFLIGKGGDIDAPKTDGQTPLHIACKCGHKDMAELLVAKGANLNAKDNKGRTPLSLAKEQGHKEIVDLLLTHGAKE